MSHLIVIVITLISTITVDKQLYFIFPMMWLTFIACFLSTLYISQSKTYIYIIASLAGDSEPSSHVVLRSWPSAVATSWMGPGDWLSPTCPTVQQLQPVAEEPLSIAYTDFSFLVSVPHIVIHKSDL